MELVPFDYDEHAWAFLEEEFADGATGLALLRDDGTPCMVGGTAPFPWGPELWIYTVKDVTPGERVRIGRVARDYLATQLAIEPRVFAHARPGNERWLSWLGFRFEYARDDQYGREMQRWIKEAAWGSR